MRLRRSKRSGNVDEEPDDHPHHAEAHQHHQGEDDHHHHQGEDEHHHQGEDEDHQHQDGDVNDPWSWIRLAGGNRSRRDVRYVPKFIETALVLDKAMVKIKNRVGLYNVLI